MEAYEYGIKDFEYIAAGASILASGGGGSYLDAVQILQQLAARWSGRVNVRDYDGATNCCVLALMGSPDAADALNLDDIFHSMMNTVNTFQTSTGQKLGCYIPVEIGPINSLAPLIAAIANNTWVVNGDGAGRAVPQLPQTTYGGAGNLPVAPCALANDAEVAKHPADLESALLTASNASTMESLAGGIVGAFNGYSGIALWPSTSANGYALRGNYIPGTLEQTRALGQFLMTASSAPSTANVATMIAKLTGRAGAPIATNFYITSISQSTTSASLDTGVIRLDNNPDPARSTETHFIYNLNENLIMYSSKSSTPDAIAPDSICYYSEATGRGFSNATNDLDQFYDAKAKKSNGKPVSVIKVETAPALYKSHGVVASFAALLQKIGYGGAMPAR